MLRIIHISDLHFHADRKKNTRTERLLDAINKRYFVEASRRRQSYLLVTGDIVDEADAHQYELAKAALRPFKGRLLLAMGNHDCCVLGNFYRPKALPLFDKLYLLTAACGHGATARGSKKAPVRHDLVNGDTRVVTIGLDSTLHTQSARDWSCGAIGNAQLDALRRMLAPPRWQPRRCSSIFTTGPSRFTGRCQRRWN